ncbi:MAG TPA: UvrD-helicase domain-containing protein, partial [Candidatus Saccharimonadales bacterium]
MAKQSGSKDQPNKQQRLAIEHGNGPMLVVAGAGTGKTKVIVERILRLIADGVDGRTILALTFTEKAAQEMLDRVVQDLSGSYGLDLPITTFNAFGEMILKEFAPEIGLGSNLRLLGDVGKIVFLKEHLDELDLDYFAPISKPDGQLGNLGDYFSRLKQQLVWPQQYSRFANALPKTTPADKLEQIKHQELAKAYKTYIELCRQLNFIDYDDQLFMLVELLKRRPNVLAKLRQRYKYVLVDEFQDTNPMQSAVIDLLVEVGHNLMAVGDDDQS